MTATPTWQDTQATATGRLSRDHSKTSFLAHTSHGSRSQRKHRVAASRREPTQGVSGDSWDFSSVHDDPFLPSPSNTPTQEDDGLLYPPRGGMWTLTDRPGIDLARLSARSTLTQVYVILFGVGQRDTEGIYSLRAFNDEGLPQETIIVFEDEEDCARYAGLLEATMDHVPAVCTIPPAELLDFCSDAGYQCRLEPCGSLLIPPDYNVGITDWERSMRLREGQWAVLEAEPDHSTQTGTHHLTRSAVQVPQAPGHPLATVTPARTAATRAASVAKYHPSFSEDELAEIRTMLESLLPASDAPDPQQDTPPGPGQGQAGEDTRDEQRGQ